MEDAEAAQTAAVRDATKNVNEARDDRAKHAKKVQDEVSKIEKAGAGALAQANKDIDAARKRAADAAKGVAADVAKANQQFLDDIAAAQARFAGANEGFVGAMRRIGTVIRDDVLPFIDRLKDALGPLGSFIGENVTPILVGLGTALAVFGIAQLAGVIAGLGATAAGFLGISTAAAPVAVPVGAIAIAVGLLAAGAYLAYQKIKPFHDIVDTVGRLIRDTFLAQLDAVINIWPRFIQPIQEIIDGVLHGFIGQVEGMIQSLKGIVEFVTGVFTGDWDKAWQGIKDIFLGPWNAIKAQFEGAGKIFAGAIDLAKGLVAAAFHGTFDPIKSIVGGAVDGAVGFFTGIPGRIGATVAGIGTAALNAGKAIVTNLVSGLGGLLGGVGSAIANLATTIANGLGNIGKKVGNTFVDAVNAVIRVINGIQIKLPAINYGPVHLGGQTIGLPNIPQLPRFAEGGLVMPRPGGILANIGEGTRPEAVLPLPPGFIQAMEAFSASGGRSAAEAGGSAAPLIAGDFIVNETSDARATGIAVVRELRSLAVRRGAR